VQGTNETGKSRDHKISRLGSVSREPKPALVVGTGVECAERMKPNEPKTDPKSRPRTADPRLVWLASVLAAATLIIYLAHQA
jgi:hypothetical protein